MLWRFRRELVLILFILVSIWILRHNLTFRPNIFKQTSAMKELSPEVRTIIIENENLRKLLGLKQNKGFSKLIYANTKTVSPWVFPSVITVDKGFWDGVKENMAIVNRSGSLIGRIIQVKENVSIGITIYHPDSKISVMVAETGELAVMEGLSLSFLYPNLKVKFLPPECKASVGDTIETSGLTRLYPCRVKVGKVVKIDSLKTEPVTQGFVKPFFINEDISTVAIVE
ncbi:MAG: rod shape-determining protein MreC [Candidatus Omnitrophica bacterium]|nr:rod shape-determining protein MreC [Candidatus Omnitrophota bacterium]